MGENWVDKGYDLDDICSTVVLVGNGVNLAFQKGESWFDLIQDIADHVDITLTEDEKKLPFPLLYESILLRGYQGRREGEERLMDVVTRNLSRLSSEPLNDFFGKLKINHLLTTNYDLATVQSFLSKEVSGNHAPVRETRYSLFRRLENDRSRKRRRRVVWQIHGSEEYTNSIMLGHEHYSGYLETIRQYVTSGVEYSDKPLSSLVHRLRSDTPKVRTWADFFFLDSVDVVIVGLSLDFVEMHLWWLLTYRARASANEKIGDTSRVIYITPDPPEDSEAQNKLHLLESTGVEIKSLSRGDDQWIRYYNEAAEYINSLT